jgi:hypothetical protein
MSFLKSFRSALVRFAFWFFAYTVKRNSGKVSLWK